MSEIVRGIVEQGLEGIGRYYSMYRAYVVSNEDPDNTFRLKVCIPDINGAQLWAIPRNQHGSLDNGFKYLEPSIGDVVWVEFENGDITKPVWSYHGWALNELPVQLGNGVLGFVTPNGNYITIDESDNHLEVYIKGDATIYSEDNLDIASGKVVMINAGNNGGMVNIEELTNKLNNLINELEKLKLSYNTHVHTGVTTGVGTSGTTTPYNDTFSKFNKGDYEDTKCKH